MATRVSWIRRWVVLGPTFYCVAWLAIFSLPALSGAALVRPGDILTTLNSSATVPGHLELLRIDPKTGEHEILVRFDNNEFERITGIVVDAKQNIYLATGEATGIVRVTGAGTFEVVSSSDLFVGEGVEFEEDPGDIALLSNGFLAFGGDDAVFRVNPLNGARTVLSGRSRGVGPLVDEGEAFSVRPDGQLFVLDDGNPLLLVDPVTGNRTVVSGDVRGEGPPLIGDRIAILPKGDVLFGDADRVAYEIGRIDVLSGDRSILFDATTGTGLIPERIESMAIALEGDLLVNDDTGIFRIDLSTGDRKLIPVDTSGFITTFRNLAVVPVPEPSAMAIAATALVVLVFSCSARRRSSKQDLFCGRL